MFLAILILFVTVCLHIVDAVSTYSPARPPAVPLAVRSPYLSCWLQSRDGGIQLVDAWPKFWNGKDMGWTGFIRVDGDNYLWMGLPINGSIAVPPVNQTAFEYTSTRSIFTMNIKDKIRMDITFLSPVTPTDFKRQSLPFSYLDVKVTSLDRKNHTVQLYTDITAEWISSDYSAVVEWQYGVEPASNSSSPGIAYHQIYRQNQIQFSEYHDRTDYGNWYYATDNTTGLTYQSGDSDQVRTQFKAHGNLTNMKNTTFRAISDGFPTFGFAVDLGNVGAESVNTLFSIGLAQQQAIRFDGAQGVQPLPSLWTSYHDSDLAALSFFHTDYPVASDLTATIDKTIANDALATGGQDYMAITTLAYRQAFAGTQLAGTLNQSFLFLKEISSDGNIQTVDCLYPILPMLLYTNPALIKMALDPLFINQEAGRYPHPYSMHDLGSLYPNATGHAQGDDEAQALEECGNMLLMTLAYAQSTNDNQYLIQHFSILNQWTRFLINESLYPQDQISTDDFAGSLANQTNLALKGILAIEAMSKIASRTDNLTLSKEYHRIATKYITEWQTLAIAKDAKPPHTMLSYGNKTTFNLLYNLYPDRLLKLDLVPQSVYDMQSAFYPTVKEKYGVPLDSRHDWVKSDWQIFAASVANKSTQTAMIHDIARYINETNMTVPLSDIYIGANATSQGGFFARPVVGGFFGLLALSQPPHI